MKEVFNTTLNNFNNFNKNISNDFNPKLYWHLNQDLHDKINYTDIDMIYNHWLLYGSNENREFDIPDNIKYNFDYRIYYYLYDDVQNLYNIDDIEGLLCHYYKYGIYQKRIHSIDQIDIPDDLLNLLTTQLNTIPNNTKIIFPKSYIIKLNYYKKKYINKINKTLLIFKNHNIYITFKSIFDQIQSEKYDYIINDSNFNLLVNYLNNNKFEYTYYYYIVDTKFTSYCLNNYINNINYTKLLVDNNLLFDNNIIKLVLNNYDLFNDNDINKIKYLLILLLDINIKISIIILINTSLEDYNFIYNLWLKHIKSNNNIKIIKFDHNISLEEQINKFDYEWIIYFTKRITFNINILNRILVKYYDYDIIYENNCFYFFKNKSISALLELLQNNRFDNNIYKIASVFDLNKIIEYKDYSNDFIN